MTTKKPEESNMPLGLYSEDKRPQFHFSPPTMWCNDPNGLVYHDGEYHLFYQYDETSTLHGPMSWGHAVSSDLIHWTNLEVALHPDKLGQIFSGSAIVDVRNRSGLQKGDEKVIIAVFSQNDENDVQRQCLAYSNDRGRTFEVYQDNPVIDNPGIPDFRDPKVFWYSPNNCWMLSLSSGDRITFYRSKDMIRWNKAGDFIPDNADGVLECPDLIKFTTNGGQDVWVLIVSYTLGGPNGGSATKYYVGNFDGNTFEEIYTKKQDCWLDYGPDNYAGVTWNTGDDEADSGGPKTLVGWMSNWFYAEQTPTNPWRGAMTFPRILQLKDTSHGLRLSQSPVANLDELVLSAQGLDEIDISQNGTVDLDTSEHLLSIDLDFAKPVSESGSFGLLLKNNLGEQVTAGFDCKLGKYFVNRSLSGEVDFSEKFVKELYADSFNNDDTTISVKILVDAASIELFADGGTSVITAVFFPRSPMKDVLLFTEGVNVKLIRGKVKQLKSIWN